MISSFMINHLFTFHREVADPADGDYVEIYEANTLNTVNWEQRTIDLSAI